jgi:hypothetical protein
MATVPLLEHAASSKAYATRLGYQAVALRIKNPSEAKESVYRPDEDIWNGRVTRRPLPVP